MAQVVSAGESRVDGGSESLVTSQSPSVMIASSTLKLFLWDVRGELELAHLCVTVAISTVSGVR